MAAVPDTTRTIPKDDARTPDAVGARPSAPSRVLLAAGLLALHLAHPLTWNEDDPHLWFPPFGIGLALVAWLGPRAAVVAGLDALLVVAQAWLLGLPALRSDGARLGSALAQAALFGPQLWLTWWCYAGPGRGARRLGDPHSATLFLVAVAGAGAGTFALAQAGLAALADGRSFAQLGGLFWASRATAALTLTPALLVGLTPWLVRLRLIAAEPPGEHRGYEAPVGLSAGEWVELGGLSLGTVLLGQVLLAGEGAQMLPAWQIWGLPLLLIVWASLRHGVWGGVLVTGLAGCVTLATADLLRPDASLPLLQGNLIAQCSTALLVGTSASLIRASEARYRQVVAHIPTLLYSARVLHLGGRSGRLPTAEVTFVSPASRRLLGCEPEALLGDYELWLRKVHPEDREVLLAALAQLSRQNEPVTCEYRLAAPPDGPAPRKPDSRRSGELHGLRQEPTERWVRDTLAPHVNAAGVLVGWEGVVSDITEQRAMADDLRRTSSMFHALVADLPCGVFFVQGPNARPILVNNRARQLLGQREDPAAGLQHFPEVYRLYRPDGTPYPVEEVPVYLALRRGANTMRDDIVVHRPDGRRVPLVTWATPIDLGGRGSRDAAVWVFEDLTALHQAEAARRETAARLRTVIETMSEGLVVQDASNIIVEGNPAACAILGLTMDQLRGRSLADPGWGYVREDGSPFPADEHPSVLSLRGGRPVRNVLMGLTGAAGGPATRWVLVSAVPLRRGRNPLPTSVVTTLTDISAHRHVLETLQTSEEKYRGLVESLPLMLIQSDRDQNVTYVNPATEAITGYSREDLARPELWHGVIHADDLLRVRAASDAAQAGQPQRVEFRYRARDGTEHVAFALLQPRLARGEVVGVTSLIVDVTRERALEQELQRAQRLELVGRLAGGIAHDFNNLLSVVLTLTELARMHLPAGHPVGKDLAKIGEAAGLAANLSRQLLTFTKQRRQAGRRSDLNQVARRTLDLLRSALPSSVELAAEVADEPLFVPTDETQLQQVLINLCFNARDAMPEGGRIEVRAEPTACVNGHEGAGRWARLSVRDNGQGMPDHVREQVFDPFFSTKERGTGLGLAMVRQIVEAHGGRVEVTSQLGQGSTFTVWLPEDA